MFKGKNELNYHLYRRFMNNKTREKISKALKDKKRKVVNCAYC